MYDAVSLEERQKPTAVIINEGFVLDACATAASKGMPRVRIVPTSVPSECTVLDVINSGISKTADDIIKALTQPLTDEDVSPKPQHSGQGSRIVHEGTLHDVNQFFYKQWWTDGLPIIPPTEEAVQEMLLGTDLSPDFIIGKMIPRSGKATVEKIAINAVMAGALPVHMPILIAGVEAVIEEEAKLGMFGVSTGGWTPFWIINGPVRQDVSINCSTGALGPGELANAAIGRAMELIIKNIGGARTGIEDMATFGNPGKYTMILGEREDESPWEPLHVEHGFDQDDSAVTVFFPNTYNQIMGYGTDEKAVLSSIIYNILPGRKGLCAVLMTPQHARTFAESGWSKEDIKNYIVQNARAPFYQRPEHFGAFGPITPGLEKKITPANPLDSTALFRDPEWIKIIVTGGPGNIVGMAVGAAAPGGKFVTKKMHLPKEWEHLVRKYKVEKVAPF